MKTKLFLLIINLCAFSGLGVSSVFARIGETIEQADARYGTPAAVTADGYGGLPERTYRKDGIQIVAHFLNGKIGAIDFSKMDGADFSASEFKVVVRAQGVNVSDKEILAPKERLWVVMTPLSGNVDSKIGAVATYDHETKLLKVFTSDYAGVAGEAEEVRKRKAAEEKLKSF